MTPYTTDDVTRSLQPLPDQGDGIFSLPSYGRVARIISRVRDQGVLVLISEEQYSTYAVRFQPAPIIKFGEKWYELARDGVREALLGLHTLGVTFPDEGSQDHHGLLSDLLRPVPGDEAFSWWYMVTHVAGAQDGNREGDILVTQGAAHWSGTLSEWDEPIFTPGLSIQNSDAPHDLKLAVLSR